jgi:TRIAD3 protein (E3 ubiquitin-protein ligase RNF216)
MVQCADGHLFCATCLKRYVEETIFGAGKTVLYCMDANGCKERFPDSQLKKALPANVYQKMTERLQEEEIKKAGLDNLVECPL